MGANTLTTGKFIRHRISTGTPVVADPAVDTAFPTPVGSPRRSNLNTNGAESVIVGVVLGGGTTPTATLVPFLYDEERDRYFALPATAALSDEDTAEVDCFEGLIFFRISAVSGAPTSVEIRVMPAKTAVAKGA